MTVVDSIHAHHIRIGIAHSPACEVCAQQAPPVRPRRGPARNPIPRDVLDKRLRVKAYKARRMAQQKGTA